jgi:hypothetical protein
MTPLLRKLSQHSQLDTRHGHKPLASLRVWRNRLAEAPPMLYIHPDIIHADVGYEWLIQNLSEEEFTEYAAMKCGGFVS